MPCHICRYNQVKDVDRALLAGAALSSLSQKYGFSVSALHRHKEHLMQKMAQAQTRFHDSLHQGLFCKLNIVLELVLQAVRAANAGGDFKLFLQASREVTRIIGLMHKMIVPLDPELIYCLMGSPQWSLQDSLLPNAFQALADTRQTLALNLFAPCPEPEPEPDPATAKSSPLAAPDSNLETPDQTGASADQSSHRQILPGLVQPQASQSKTENPPRNQREMSAKKARKNPRKNNNTEEYLIDTPCEKKSAKISRFHPAGLWQRLIRSGK
jgi:hypothetical protein